jgi:hypothetical protein
VRLVLIRADHPGAWKVVFCDVADVAVVVRRPGARRSGFGDSRVVTVESAREDYGVVVPS